ncbi:MAG: acyl-CoA dehydrogenase family protein [Pseudomonadota bacterium]
MDFAETAEQEAILRTVDRLVERHLPLPAQRRYDAQKRPPYHLLPVLGEAGLLGLAFPKADGGLAAGWDTVACVQHRLGLRAWMLGSLMNRAVGFGGMALAHFGAPQQRALLGPLIEGRLLFALALTEPQAGSDAAAITTLAEPVAQGYRLTGRKSWISDAREADFMVTVARRPGSAGREGISLFLVGKDTPGVAFTPIPTIGNNCLPSFEVSLDGALLASDALLGEPGQGFAHLMSILHYARAGMAAAVSGYAQFAVDLAVAHAQTRRQFGRPIGRFQALAHRLADMQMRVDQARLTAFELAWRIREGLPCARQAAAAKIVSTETLQAVAEAGMQIMASAGYAAESDMARIWRDARLYSFGEGANEIQRNIVAREMGL